MDIRDIIYNQIITERFRQDKKWGIQNHSNFYWYAILGEEFGEVGRAIMENNKWDINKEITQVAAVCIAWLENLRDIKKSGILSSESRRKNNGKSI